MTGPPTQGQLNAIARRIDAGASVLRSWPLAGGVSAAMTAFEVADAEGATRRYVLRQPPGWSSAGHEQRLLSLVQGRGVPVPVPRLAGEAGDVLEGDWLVLDYAEGEPYFGPAFGPRRATAMATALAAIHAIDTAASDFSFLRSEGDGRTLLHGDFWPGNVLWQGEELAAVIDWEDSILGDALFDVAITRLDLALIHGAEAAALFTARYFERTGTEGALLPHWDARAVARQEPHLEAWNGGWADLGRPDLTMDVIRERFAAFAGQTRG